MPDEKISQLPPVTTVATGDLAVAVASNVTSKITMQQLIDALVGFITADVNIGAGDTILGEDGSARFAGGLITMDTSGNLVISNILLANAIELNSLGSINMTSVVGSEPMINLTDAFSGNCYMMFNLDASDSTNSVIFGINPSGCFFQYGPGFNTFQIQANGGGLGNISTSALALSQSGGATASPACGTAQLNGTTPVVVNCAYIQDDSLVFLTINSPSGTLGVPLEISSSRVDGTSFSIRSTVALDTSTVAWMVLPNADTLPTL